MTPCGKTNLIGETGVKKSDLRIRLIGVLDEASASLSLARAFCSPGNQTCLETCQKDLSRMMGLLAALPKTPLAELMGSFAVELRDLEATIKSIEAGVTYPNKFIHPGSSPATGALNLARAIVRRAEREAVAAFETLQIPDESMLQYLNRLSTLCYLLILAETPLG
jgi:cob(I)alamin adenosyltransferase